MAKLVLKLEEDYGKGILVEEDDKKGIEELAGKGFLDLSSFIDEARKHHVYVQRNLSYYGSTDVDELPFELKELEVFYTNPFSRGSNSYYVGKVKVSE
ncbi:MAG: hypothetical protein WDZ62_00495 [Candidatus Pacearchaeota archaeon]